MENVSFLFIFLLSVTAIICIPTNSVDSNELLAQNKDGLFTGPEVFITLSSIAGINASNSAYLDTLIELNWARFDYQPGDWIGLFDTPDFSEPPLVSINVNSSLVGYFKTNVRFGHPILNTSSEGLDNNCLGYWITYMRFSTLNTSEAMLSNCLRKYPRWMNELAPIIGNTPLHSLLIPGTHDAGAIRIYDGEYSENLGVRYSVNQEFSLYDQFIYGIRYLDMRVAYYENTEEKFWINHGNARFEPLITLFNAIKLFVNATNEIIFMDFHGFPVGMENVSRHEELIEFVQNEIGYLLVHESMVPTTAGFNVTPNMLWEINRTVILTYQREDINSQYDFLWPYLIHAWGNKNLMEPLQTYFEEEALPEYGCKGIFWSAMAEMTPRTLDSFLYPFRGLRGFAQMANLPVTYWWERPHWYSRSMIVSTDFFLGNNIIEMAVKVNGNKAVCNLDNSSSGGSMTRSRSTDSTFSFIIITGWITIALVFRKN